MIDIQELTFEPLDDSHDEKIQRFDCGNPLINGYLRTSFRAKLDHNLGLTATTIVTYEEAIVAFFTACCSQIKIADDEESKSLGGVKYVPAIEIKYLAVDQMFQKQGIGDVILQSITGEAFKLSSWLGCRYIFLWAVKDAVVWYENRYFKITESDTREEGLVLMRFQIPPDHDFDE